MIVFKLPYFASGNHFVTYWSGGFNEVDVMTIAKPRFFSLPSPSEVLDLVRARFGAQEQVGAVSAPQAKSVPGEQHIEPSDKDHSRYARLLEKELDRQHLSAVEREDSAMLSRVRSALYED